MRGSVQGIGEQPAWAAVSPCWWEAGPGGRGVQPTAAWPVGEPLTELLGCLERLLASRWEDTVSHPAYPGHREALASGHRASVRLSCGARRRTRVSSGRCPGTPRGRGVESACELDFPLYEFSFPPAMAGRAAAKSLAAVKLSCLKEDAAQPAAPQPGCHAPHLVPVALQHGVSDSSPSSPPANAAPGPGKAARGRQGLGTEASAATPSPPPPAWGALQPQEGLL